MTAVAIVDMIIERGHQEQKFPEQHLPSWNVATGIVRQVIRLTTGEAKEIVDSAMAVHGLSWPLVLLEELLEAFDEAATGDVVALRAELVQVAAVALRWIEDLDREAT
jgi:hypothetical protein